jgi:hypothetical protein
MLHIIWAVRESSLLRLLLQAYELVDAELKLEEEEKERLCNELNLLITSSTQLQMQKMDELKQHLEMLSSGIDPAMAMQMHQQQVQMQQMQQQMHAQEQAHQQQQQQQQAGMGFDAAVAAAGPGSAAAGKAQASAAGGPNGHQQTPQRPVVPQRNPEDERAAAEARSRHISIGSGPPPAASNGGGGGGRAQQQEPGAQRPRPSAAKPAAASRPTAQASDGGRGVGGAFVGFDS